ncbi:hypothetical protein FIU97_01855 [Roseivivax sp. THAF40]|uniref:anthrone oxygenase family protein n=1 Tax=unclassified Roseivivax TaxID=2639302 RepID=UPI0012678CED|nr:MULTISPECIES: anthrone oxygenase family protein [unclassified Roseivivax]QFS81579.1 hypothetical protein FIV09_01945 [Roseivivax sp. THAF197b]QFT45308.1 hypothetical protein FIU97_01855 [Roseivivax sp. THAF40]
MPSWFFVLAQFSLLAYALLAGVFLAFSDFIMRALSRTGGTGGIEVMQVINREVFRHVFIPLFIAMAALSLGIAAYGAAVLGDAPGYVMALAGLIYLIGCFGVTIRGNVPMNEALDRMDLSDAETTDYWRGIYLPRWTFWNTIRSVACAISAVLMLVALTSLAKV